MYCISYTEQMMDLHFTKTSLWPAVWSCCLWLTCTYYFPDILSLQLALPALHISYDFVGLLTHGSHIQLGLVTVSCTNMLVQAAPDSVTETVRDEHTGSLSWTLSSRRLQRCQQCASDSNNHADRGRHVCPLVADAFKEYRSNRLCGVV